MPTRLQSIAFSMAIATVLEKSIKSSITDGSRSNSLLTSCLGTQSVCPLAFGLTSKNARN